MDDPLRHHGDVEATSGLLDLAVNVYPGPRPAWLEQALRASLDDLGAYPDAAAAEAALARHHGRTPAEVLATAGAAEAFGLVARLRPWRRASIVHPQFTEPHAALEQAGAPVTSVVLEGGFVLDPRAVPEDADLVVLGNPTNPTGVLHPVGAVRALARPGRLLVVDEAFMDTVPDESESLAGRGAPPGVLVVRSLTKHWGIPGVRAGYVLGDPDVVAGLRRGQTPWSVSTQAVAAMTACATEQASIEAGRRAARIAGWREHLHAVLVARGIPHVPSRASFVLARVGAGVHAALRAQGIAVRRADTFPGLDPSWVRIAVRPPAAIDQLAAALDALRAADRPPALTASRARRRPMPRIAPPSDIVRAHAVKRLGALATPPGALGRLGDLAVWLAATQAQVPPAGIDNPRLVIFAGDHGVAAHGVSAFPPAITGAMVRTFLSGRAGVSALAAVHGVQVRVLDLGVDEDFDDLDPQVRAALQAHKVRRSSGAIHLEDALTPPEARAALDAGVAVADEEIAAGAELLISGDMGIGNTTAATALVAAGLGLPAAELVGRGTGIDDAALALKRQVVQAALDRVGDRAEDALETLTALGSADLAATTGYLLRAAERGVPVLLDGLMSVACALTADRLAPGAAAWFAAGHRSTEPAQALALDKLGLEPLLDLGMRLGEGSGAVAAVPLLRSAAAVLRDVALLTDLVP